MFPLFSTQVVMTLTQSGVVVSQLVAVYALMSTTLNGLLNPFVYGALSRQYRDGYFKLLNSLGSKCGLQRICKSKECLCYCKYYYVNICVVV